jgi:Coenzyme PQQ synthesis protein D (PqqD)
MIVRVNPWVTHERLDDQVLAIHLETGAYFALDDVAAECWTASVAGASLEDVAAQVATRYQIDPATARADVERFAQDLATERLVELAEASDATAPAPLEPVATRLPYVAPTVQKYDDLEDLLLLDPIHEVDEAGWPVPLAE